MSYVLAFWIVVVVSAVFTSANSAIGMYVRNLLVSATQFINTVTGGNPDQSFSARCGANRKASNNSGPWAWLASAIDEIFMVVRGEVGHCATAMMNDNPLIMRYQLTFPSALGFMSALLAVFVLAMFINHI